MAKAQQRVSSQAKRSAFRRRNQQSTYLCRRNGPAQRLPDSDSDSGSDSDPDPGFGSDPGPDPDRGPDPGPGPSSLPPIHRSQRNGGPSADTGDRSHGSAVGGEAEREERKLDGLVGGPGIEDRPQVGEVLGDDGTGSAQDAMGGE